MKVGDICRLKINDYKCLWSIPRVSRNDQMSKHRCQIGWWVCKSPSTDMVRVYAMYLWLPTYLDKWCSLVQQQFGKKLRELMLVDANDLVGVCDNCDQRLETLGDIPQNQFTIIYMHPIFIFFLILNFTVPSYITFNLIFLNHIPPV